MLPEADLKLAVFDDDDLAVVSAHLQDALVRVGDALFLRGERRFVLVASRFDWQAAAAGRLERVKTGLHFERVRRVETSKLRREAPDAVLNLLAIRFEPGDAPSGYVTLTFSAGVAIRLDVECLEAQMRDIGPRWAAAARPGHKVETVS